MNDVIRAAARGGVGAMAMTGLRTLAQGVGLVRETPPEAIFRQRLSLVMAAMPRGRREMLKAAFVPRRRRALMEAAHVAFGAVAGAGYGALPAQMRQAPWSGPVYGLLVWSGYQLGMAPALGLSHSRRLKPAEQATFVVDHVLYGLVLAEPRRAPQP